MAKEQEQEYEVLVDIHQGVGKKSGKPFEALKITIGEYETLVFPTKIEMAYIKHILETQ